jgi:hypothetical protein
MTKLSRRVLALWGRNSSVAKQRRTPGNFNAKGEDHD